jgi:hypothetical protein
VKRKRPRSPLEGDSKAAIKARAQKAAADLADPCVKLTSARRLARSVARAAGVPPHKMRVVMKALQAARSKPPPFPAPGDGDPEEEIT